MLVSEDPTFEFINYHGNTSMFALDILRRRGRLEEMKLLSISCLMPHLADYLSLFHTVNHNSLTTTRLPMQVEKCSATFVEHKIDFFDLPKLEIDCVISHAAIHCFNDPRYGNAGDERSRQKPYEAAKKLRQIVGAKPVPTIISVAVNRDEGFYTNNVHLSHEKFVQSFADAGFELREHFFDFVCGGIAQKPEYLDFPSRRSKVLPDSRANPKEWVAGNYYFL